MSTKSQRLAAELSRARASNVSLSNHITALVQILHQSEIPEESKAILVQIADLARAEAIV